jgi:CheY-like chemotaxis protein
MGPFEIFRKVSDGRPTWIETCTSLECASERAREMMSIQLGDYFIFDRHNQRFVDPSQEPPIMSSTRILVADDHEAVRKGICWMLQGRGHVEIVGEASNGKEAIERTFKLQPDLIIMDISMPIMDGLTAAQIIKKGRPQTAILVLSMHKHCDYGETAKELGLNGYVSKSEKNPAILRAIEAVLNNQTYFPTYS